MLSQTENGRSRHGDSTGLFGSHRKSGTLETDGLLLFRIFDEYLLLMSESGTMKHRITHFLSSLAIPISNSAGTTSRLAIFKAPGHHIVLCCPECGVAQTAASASTAWFVFRRLLLHLIINMGRPHFPLHACCVANERGEAAVISGLSNSGKTSVTAALLRYGYRFAIDDYTLLMNDASILAFPLGSTLSQKTFTLIPDIEPLKAPHMRLSDTDAGPWIVNFADVFPIVEAFKPLKPTHFFFLVPRFGAQSRLEPCSTEQSLWHLQAARLADRKMIKPLKCASPRHYDMGLSIAGRLIEDAAFFRVVNGDLGATAALIAETFNSGRR